MTTERTRRNPPRISTDDLTPEQEARAEAAAQKIRGAMLQSEVMERAALRDLDTSLALTLKQLLPVAVKQSQDTKKPDSRLLRLIVRYTSAKNRELATKQRDRTTP